VVRAGAEPAEPATGDPGAGLGAAEVRRRVAAGLVNRVPPPPARTVTQILRANVLTRFNAILGVLFAAVLVVGPLQDALFGGVLVANTAIGVFQELRAKRTLDRLAILNEPRARAVRDAEVVELAVEELVLDDVLELHPGDQVPVDGVVLISDGLEIDESLLSGEPQPVGKRRGEQVLSGSFVAAGTGRVRATAVGADAYAGRLEAYGRQFRLIRSELQQGTNWILRLVTWAMVPVGAALVVSQLVRSHQHLADAVRGSVAGVAAMVPEGLVLLTSVAFALGAIRLAHRQVLVQELAAVEGLARVDVLCIDKTGTLTTAGMHLESVEPLDDRSSGEVRSVLAAVAAADPAPNATVRALSSGVGGVPGWSTDGRVPFSSERKWSAVSFTGHGHWVLGAPEVLAAAGRGAVPAGRSGATAGGRVLLLAESPVAVTAAALPDGLAPAALVVLREQLRPDAAETVAYLVEQGVTVKVLSGDAPSAVAAVADAAGVPALGEPVDARALADDQAVGEAVGRSNVLGRVTPEQKRAAVRRLQADGHVVAMVGDGVNDVAALKEADLGIAMGAGSPSSRAVARIVLLDSRFAVVPDILAEGRRVAANIERVANLFVTKTVYAVLLAVVVAAAAVPFPFFPRHLTVVSSLTIGVPGFFLALAAGAPRAVPGFTRRVLRFTVPAGTAGGAATLAVYWLARAAAGTSLVQARTAAMLALFAVGLWVLLLVARPWHPARVALVVAMGGLLVPLVAFPLARRWLLLAVPPAAVGWESALAVATALVTLTLWRGLARRARRPAGGASVAPEPTLDPGRRHRRGSA